MRQYSNVTESPPLSPRIHHPNFPVPTGKLTPARSILELNVDEAPFRGMVNDRDDEEDSDFEEEEDYNTLTPQLLLQTTHSRPVTPIHEEERRRSFINRRKSYPSRASSIVFSQDFWKESDTRAVALNDACRDHIKLLIRQLINRFDLSTLWEQVMYNLSKEVGRKVTCGEEMDIRQLIRIKKIPGGKPEDSFFLSGAVCKKTLAHRKMRQRVPSPRIVILTFPLEYHRVQDRLMSLSPVLSQEREYLMNLCNRVLALNPQVILVEKTVARVALEYLYSMNISVAYNIKSLDLERIARFTGAHVITSIDKLEQTPSIGKCGTFRVRMFAHGQEVVPMLLFEGCPPELGGCIILRGEEAITLRKVKLLLRFILFAFVSLLRETQVYQALQSKFVISDSGIPLETQGVGAEDALLSKLIAPYQVILSISPGVCFPPPYLIEKYRKEVQNRKRSHTISPFNSILQAGNGRDLGPGIEKASRDALQYILDEDQDVSPLTHQSILFLSCTITATSKCIVQDLQFVEYYGTEDVTILQYLEHMNESLQVRCTVCPQSMKKHRKIYYHGQKSVCISFMDEKELPINGVVNEYFPSDHPLQNQLYCKKCEKWQDCHDFTPDAAMYSFAKYLELCFYSDKVCSIQCGHQIFNDFLHIFILDGKAISIDTQQIVLFEIQLPPIRIQLDAQRALNTKEAVRAKTCGHIEQLFSTVHRYLSNYLNQKLVTIANGASTDKINHEETARALYVIAQNEKRDLIDMCNNVFEKTTLYDIISFNNVVRILVDRSRHWMDEITKFKISNPQANEPKDASSTIAPLWISRAIHEMSMGDVSAKPERPSPSNSPPLKTLFVPPFDFDDEEMSGALPSLEKTGEEGNRAMDTKGDKNDKRGGGIVQSLVNLLTSNYSQTPNTARWPSILYDIYQIKFILSLPK
jgi:hypothetical protein